LGGTAGALIAYGLALRAGRPLLLRHGSRIGLNEARFAAAERFFARYGLMAVFLGRIISGVRLVVGYAAGLFGVAPRPFVGYSVLGALTWALLDSGAGLLVGRHLAGLEAVAVRYAPLWLALAVALGAAYGMWRRRPPRGG
jgi:membrane protein DedA with SNARE-associated domain